MSSINTKLCLGILSHKLKERYETGMPVYFPVDDKPAMHILSLAPIDYKPYGIIFNRAHHIKGSLALRGFLTSPYPNTLDSVYAAALHEDQIYGFEIDLNKPSVILEINGVAKALGLPSLKIK